MQNQGQTTGFASDKDILQDLLMTEKHVSGMYDTAIMECANEGLRNTLKQIQDDEQNHAKMIFDLMNKKGWYKVQ